MEGLIGYCIGVILGVGSGFLAGKAYCLAFLLLKDKKCEGCDYKTALADIEKELATHG